MKQRITYLVNDPHSNAVDPSTIQVSKNDIQIPRINAAKEHRLTFSVSELPQELWNALKQCHEFRIRWAKSTPYFSSSPLASRVPAGFHAFFTPRKGSSAELLCPMIKKVFGDELKCESPKDTFVSLPILSERFSMSPAMQYYQLLPSLQNFVTYIQQKLCGGSDPACSSQAAALLSVDYLDIDYDVISHAVIVNAYWWNNRAANSDGSWEETIRLRDTETIEVGILNTETPDEPEELKLGGFLTVVGQDSKPKATLFSFPSRHHAIPTNQLTYSATFLQPTGLHPTLKLDLHGDAAPPTEGCALHAYATLPSHLFVDKYQFQDPLFLASLNISSLRTLAGATDLEAPDWVVRQWGSAALFELAGSPSSVSIPLHLRYLPPSQNTSGIVNASVPWPVVFWACPAEEGSKMSNNPFDRVNLGYDGLFGPKTMFYHVDPPGGLGIKTEMRSVMEPARGLVETLSVPVLDLDKGRAWGVEVGTAVAVVLGMGWVLWGLVRGWGGGRGREVEGVKEGKKDE
ncbi:PIG-X-domain-containing protein [Saccharata proteae CBS 121410]|uniref:Protein PBN1 n=1 Tax=Saccharata proteae CBS 121410 TaxID=1314787 RepID=A0A9P4LZD5_9PEZI|nr:PIG-X-domain-containing protein [Saccharata proteae CBS 121410]